MESFRREQGFTLIEVVVAVAVFVIFAMGIYGGITIVFKVVYSSRLQILESAALDEQLELVKNLVYENVGTIGGNPVGVLPPTQTIARNGINFFVTTTVSDVDDPYDGLAGGNPNDTVPADYKLVEMSIRCAVCKQQQPVVLSTRVAPKRGEGASGNGDLYIHVFDADGEDVSGANVQVVNNQASPAVVLDNVTDDGGFVRLFSMPTGTLAYNITVTKAGYSSDYTISPTTTGESDPTKLPASVASQGITEINFAIDQLAALTVHSLNADCSVNGSRKLELAGTKLLATNPDVYRFDQKFTTNAEGLYSWPTLEWDTYAVSSTDNAYTIAGTIPMSPWDIDPGVAQDASVILVAHSDNNLLVSVTDAVTGQPLSGATVALTDGGAYDTTLLTGLGFINQTDWSGGDKQAAMKDDKKYWSNDGGVDTKSPKGDVALKKAGKNYVASGWLESSTFDLGTSVNFNNLIFNPRTQATSTGPSSVSVQLAASNSSTPMSWNFTGPDGTNSTYYTATATLIWSGLNGNRYVRYRLFLSTNNTSYTPDFYDLSITYTDSCSPPGQAFFPSLKNNQVYAITVSHDGYIANSGSVTIQNDTRTQIDLSPSS